MKRRKYGENGHHDQVGLTDQGTGLRVVQDAGHYEAQNRSPALQPLDVLRDHVAAKAD